jgi:hypothetical protein
MASPAKLHPALLGGLFIGVVSALPYVKGVNNCCCLWLAVGGVLAAWVMQQNHPRPVALGDGAVVGLLAGVSGAVVKLAATALIASLAPGQVGSVSRDAYAASEGMPPEFREVLRSVPPAMFVLVEGLMFLVIGSIISTVGGILGAAIFRRRVAVPAAEAPMPAGWEAPVSPAPPPIPEARDQGPPDIDSPS